MAPFDLDACIEQLLRKQLLHEALLREICEKTKEVLMRESNVVHVSAPVTVVGDIHGDFYSLSLEIPHEGPMADLVWSDPDPEKEDFAISPRFVACNRYILHGNFTDCFSGAGYTFGSGVVHKFLEINKMSHILRAHQLCMEGYASLFDRHLSTVWSAPNYCYRCGNSASILEVGPGGSMYFNVFEAAPENERDGPTQQAAQNASGKVSVSIS
ncbi:hypothetical protein HHX47_DHR3000321 [Lentinula edodes]|nr:hypothetical protein HHX47_DHR3000321 [Lentinula edodes]